MDTLDYLRALTDAAREPSGYLGSVTLDVYDDDVVEVTFEGLDERSAIGAILAVALQEAAED